MKSGRYKSRLKVIKSLAFVDMVTVRSARKMAGKRRFWKVVQHLLKKPRLTIKLD